MDVGSSSNAKSAQAVWSGPYYARRRSVLARSPPPNGGLDDLNGARAP